MFEKLISNNDANFYSNVCLLIGNIYVLYILIALKLFGHRFYMWWGKTSEKIKHAYEQGA